jgi:uncharacterized protein YdhG (YjbR/CyaY superfamily)
MARKNRPGKSDPDPEKASKEIDAILAASPKEHRAALQKIRETIREIVPDAVEGISYSIPAFRYKGKPLAGYASLKDHCSYFPMSGKLTAKFKKELKDFKTSKGGIQFQPEHPIPSSLLKKLLLERIKEIEGA